MVPRPAPGIVAGGLEKIPTRDDAARVVFVCRLVGFVVLVLGCGHGPDPLGTPHSRELILAHDDGRVSASLTFPNLTYESLLRFELPPGKHRPLRLRLMAESAGAIAITFYDNNVLETPGEEIFVINRELVPDDLAGAKDSRWVVQDLRDVPPLQGVVWIGVRKVGGAPSIWTSSVVSGQTYLRDRNPASGMGLLPVKRTPLIRLEVLP